MNNISSIIIKCNIIIISNLFTLIYFSKTNLVAFPQLLRKIFAFILSHDET